MGLSRKKNAAPNPLGPTRVPSVTVFVTVPASVHGLAVTASGSLCSGTYTVDGNGLRVKKVAGSTSTVYIFSGSKVIAEYQNGAAPSSPTTEYVYAGGTLLAKINSSSTFSV